MNAVPNVTPICTGGTLYVRDGSRIREATPEEIIQRADALICQRYRKGAPVLDNPKQLAHYLRIHIGSRRYPVFGMLHLDGDSRLIAAEELFRGADDKSPVYTREVMRSVLDHHTVGIVFFQNYPLSCAEPKDDDIHVAQRLTIAMSVFGITVHYHMIIGTHIYSLAARGFA